MTIRKRSVTDIVVMGAFLLLTLLILLPLWYVLVISLSTAKSYAMDPLHLWPHAISLAQYKMVFTNAEVMRSFGVSLMVTLSGTVVSMLLSIMGGYSLSKKGMPGRRFLLTMIVITMFFSGGLVPYYLLVRNLGLNNTFFALILPMAINSFNLIILKNHFVSFPLSLEESAKLDGYNDVQILVRIVIPLSMPVIATIALFYAVGYWNDYFQATLFISSNKMYPMQVVLRQMIIQQSVVGIHGMNGQTIEQFKMACVVVGILPMLAMYPFIQRFFSKGVMIGAIKE